MKTSLDRLLEKYPDVEVISARQSLDAATFDVQQQKNEHKLAEGAAIGVVWLGLDIIVLARRTRKLHPGWSLLGGTVEQGQDFDDAFRREALEESGMRVRIDRLVAVEQKIFVSPGGQELSMSVAVFEATALPGEAVTATIEAKEEGLEVAAFELDNLPQQMILADREKLDLIISQRSS